jgi:hypothetical protein
MAGNLPLKIRLLTMAGLQTVRQAAIGQPLVAVVGTGAMIVVGWIVEAGVKWAVGWLIGTVLKVKLGG